MVVVRVEDLGDGSREVLLFHGSLIVTAVKGIQAEARNCLRVPDAKRIYNVIAVAHDREVVGNRADRLVILLVEARLAVLHAGRDIAAELDLTGMLVALNLEGIAVL